MSYFECGRSECACLPASWVLAQEVCQMWLETTSLGFMLVHGNIYIQHFKAEIMIFNYFCPYPAELLFTVFSCLGKLTELGLDMSGRHQIALPQWVFWHVCKSSHIWFKLRDWQGDLWGHFQGQGILWSQFALVLERKCLRGSLFGTFLIPWNRKMKGITCCGLSNSDGKMIDCAWS